MERTLIVFVATAIMCLVAGGAAQSSQRLMPPEALIAALDKVGPTYSFFQAGASKTIFVESDRLPAKVREEAAEWVRRIVRPVYLPEGVGKQLRPETWMIRDLSRGRFDVLTTTYSLAGAEWSVSENGGSLSLLCHNTKIIAGQDPGKAAILLAKEFLNLPEQEAAKMQAELKEVPGAGVPLSCGQITIPLEPLPPEQWENTPLKDPYWHKQWYNQMFVWISPGYFYVSVVERTGRPATNLQAQPGSPPRFLPAAKAETSGDVQPAPGPAPAEPKAEERKKAD